jgi:N-methylhydantoinase B
MSMQDPIVFQVLWSRLISIADEIAATLVKTAFSLVVRDNHDYACGLYDAQGRMLVQSNQCTPGQIGSTPTVVAEMLRTYPPGQLDEGDILITNDPWIGAGHSPDVFVAQPIFLRGKLVGFACTCAHHVDMGGRLAAIDAREVYEEGVIIPVAKLVRKGVPNDELFRLLRRNVRAADKVIGDVRAQMAANHVGAMGTRRMLDAFGLDDLDHLTEAICARSEQALRTALASIPDGRVEHEVFHEETDEQGQPIRLKLALESRGDEMRLDFTGTSAQVAKPINAVLNITRAYAVFPFLAALCPEVPMNAGCFRPVRLHVPEGTVLNPTFPAPGMFRSLLSYYTVELIFGALSKIVPDKVMAPSGTYPLWIQKFAGRFDDGRPFVSHFNAQGGQGALADRDGNSTVVFPGNIASTSVELMEVDTPLVVRRKRLRADSGGPGRYRGGLGQETMIESRTGHPVQGALSGGRFDAGPLGLEGGARGMRAEIRLNDDPPFPRSTRVSLARHDRATLKQPGGGGFGEPLSRDQDAVLKDVREGYVTIEGAARDYGVVIDPATLEIEPAATLARRNP